MAKKRECWPPEKSVWILPFVDEPSHENGSHYMKEMYREKKMEIFRQYTKNARAFLYLCSNETSIGC